MKKITAIIMSLILLISLSVSASAASALTFLLQEYDVVSQDIFCYGKRLPAGGKLEVSVDSRIVEDAYLSNMEKERVPVTVYCLVDSSTSQSETVIKQRTNLLLNLSGLMAQEDSMVLSTLDATMTESKPMADKTVRDTAIRTIEGNDWRTNLYDGMSQALKNLETSTVYNTNRCLVVISECHDDGTSLAKSEEVLQQIRDIGIPVYTVALGKQVSEKDLTEQKQFAEASLGGYLSYPDMDELSASEAAQRIWESIKGAAVIRIGVEELQGAAADQQLLIRYDTAETRYEDTILVRAVDLPPVVTYPAETESTEETDPTETTEDGEDEEDEEIPVWVFVACGVGIVVLGGGIAAFCLLRKKNTASAEDSLQEWSYNEVPDAVSSASSQEFHLSGQSFSSGNVTMPVGNRCHVHLVALMHPEIAADFYLTPNLETTFGRTEKSNVLLNPKDTKLSGCHGAFFWDGKMLLVQDKNSTNGTAVNGEMCPRNVWLRLEQGSVLTAGKYDYRVTFNVD